jgi:CNT family concentrative nucleoside transporter
MYLQSALGVVALPALAWALSENRSVPPWRTVAGGLAVQFGLAFLLLKVPLFKDAFLALNAVVEAVRKATLDGTSFVFGFLGGGPLPFVETHAGASFVLAFQTLPLVLVISALSALLFYWRVLPAVVRGFAWLLRRTLGVAGPVGVVAAANVFVGMVEAPLLIRPYLRQLGRGEMFVVMTCGMATIAGTVMVLYATILATVVPDALSHILTASIVNAPAAIMIGRLMVPESRPATGGDETLPPSEFRGAMDAITAGTTDGMKLLINIVAMLIVLVALVSLANQLLALLPAVAGAPLTLQRVLGWILSPLAWTMGVPWSEAVTAGALLGTKTVLNELIAYVDMSKLPEGALSPRSRLIMTYALCGFANFGSLGIMIGGLSTMAPERRGEIIGLGMKSIVAGTIATCLTGTIVGALT